jgi:undecaprenol kinase
MIKPKDWRIIFKNAVNGCLYALRTQRNYRVHLSVSVLVILLAFWLQVTRLEWFFLLLAIFLGLTLEMVNTAFEKTIDLITQDYNEKAKIVKDLSAGMMLLLSLGLAILGLSILLPPLIQKLGL